jgi:methionyl-tRNA formyltransferase
VRIILIGQAAFAEKSLEKLVGQGDDIVAVYCPPDAPGGRPDPLKQKALQLGIPVRQHKSLKAPEVREEFVSFDADLAVLAFVTQIVPREVFSVPRLGSICFHPSLLPRYRGASAINWALIRGEPITGLTLFWVDPGMDTGPILLQREVAIDPDDTAGSLYFNKVFSLGVDAIGEAVALIKAGDPPRIVQDESRATYDPPCRDEHARIDWSRPAQDVYNLIRGCDPQPGAHATWQGKMVRIFECRLQRGDVSAASGQITDIGAEAVNVALAGGTLIVKRFAPTECKISAAEYSTQANLSVGDRLG